MAEHIAKTYSCDRCKRTIPEPSTPRHVVMTAAVAMSDTYSTDKYNWQDLCAPCSKAIILFLSERPNG